MVSPSIAIKMRQNLIDLKGYSYFIRLICSAEKEKKTGIQLIQVTDRHGNTFQRWYDFDKGEFASSPGSENIAEEDKPRYVLKEKKGGKDNEGEKQYEATAKYEITPEELSKLVDADALFSAFKKEVSNMSQEEKEVSTAIFKEVLNSEEGNVAIEKARNFISSTLGEDVANSFDEGFKNINKSVSGSIDGIQKAVTNIGDMLKEDKGNGLGFCLSGVLSLTSFALGVDSFSTAISLVGAGQALATGTVLGALASGIGSFILGGVCIGLATGCVLNYLRDNKFPIGKKQKKTLKFKILNLDKVLQTLMN